MTASCTASPNPVPAGTTFGLTGFGLPPDDIVGVVYVDPSGAESYRTIPTDPSGTTPAVVFDTFEPGDGSAWFEETDHRRKVLCHTTVVVR